MYKKLENFKDFFFSFSFSNFAKILKRINEFVTKISQPCEILPRKKKKRLDCKATLPLGKRENLKFKLDILHMILSTWRKILVYLEGT
jgi:hypothetical protein